MNTANGLERFEEGRRIPDTHVLKSVPTRNSSRCQIYRDVGDPGKYDTQKDDVN